MRERVFSRHYQLLSGLIIGALLCCFMYFILAPQIKSYARVRIELAAESDKLLKARAAAAAFNLESDRLKQAREDYEAKSGPFKQVTRDGSDIIFLGLTAASSNIAAAEIIPGDIIEKEHTFELPVKVVLQGDYRSLINFYKDIENNNSANLLEIRSLQIETINQISGAKGQAVAVKPGTVKAGAGIVIFSAKDPAGKLYLEEMSKWLTGRGDVFKPAAAVTPAPELDGYLETHAEQFSHPMPEARPAETGITVQKTKPDPPAGAGS
ncbi:MAG: hypothetical protein KBA08_03680 [Firmicutes bacterium]|nr:hypothetical protein [Bacillota bacterium]